MANEVTNKSQRDIWRERFSKANPDVNMDDEEAYYGGVNAYADRADANQSAIDNMSSYISKSPEFAEMVIAAKEQENFDPLLWFAERGDLDVEALMSDPEYVKKLAEARKKAMAKRAKTDELDKQFESNIPASMQALKAEAEKMGYDDAKINDVLERIFSDYNDLLAGKLSAETFRMYANGINHDADVEQARQEGAAAGRATRVSDKLRTFPKVNDRTGGSQAPARVAPVQRTQEEQDDMFGF